MQRSNIYIISYSLNNCIKIKNYTILFIHFKFISSSFFYLRRKESKRNHRRLIHEDIRFSRIRSKENSQKEKKDTQSFFSSGRKKKGRIKNSHGYIDIIRTTSRNEDIEAHY